MKTPREFFAHEYVWNDGTITFTAVDKDHPEAFMVREVMPDVEARAKEGSKSITLLLKELARAQFALVKAKGVLESVSVISNSINLRIRITDSLREIEALERGEA